MSLLLNLGVNKSMTRKMTEMTWPEFAACRDKVIILPVGSTEQHAQHLPLSVDAVIAEKFAEHLAEAVDGVVMPTVSYGYKSKPLSGGGPLFPGTIDLNGQTLMNEIHDILSEIIADGFSRIFIMNAHFENEAFIVEACDLINREFPNKAVIVESNWWDPMPADVIDRVFDEVPFPGWAFEHAAVTETSLMLYFAPHLCHMERMVEAKATPVPYFRYPIYATDVPETGALASAKSSTAERGKIIVDSVIPVLRDVCIKEFGLTLKL